MKNAVVVAKVNSIAAKFPANELKRKALNENIRSKIENSLVLLFCIVGYVDKKDLSNTAQAIVDYWHDNGRVVMVDNKYILF